MLQVYLVRYDCFKIQQLIPSRIICILFYTICFIDFSLLVFSCSFFIIPYQQQEFEQQYILEKLTTEWNLGPELKEFKKLHLSGQLSDIKFNFQQSTHDPYLQVNQTALYSQSGFHDEFGFIDYQIAQLTKPQIVCLQLFQTKHFDEKLFLNLPLCQNEEAIAIQPWIWNGTDIYYLSEFCLVVKLENHQVYFDGGCFSGNGFVYKKLMIEERQNYNSTTAYIRHLNDPYIKGVQYSSNYQQPKQYNHNQFPKFIYYCFLFGCAGIIYILFIYLILTLRRNSEKTQFIHNF